MYCTNWKTVVFLTVLLLTRAVAECCTSSERMHLHFLVQPFLHEDLVSSWQLDAMGDNLVQHTFHISSVFIQPKSAGWTAYIWIGTGILAPDDACLIGSSLSMFP